MDKRSLWQRKALKGSRLRLLIWGVLAAFLVVATIQARSFNVDYCAACRRRRGEGRDTGHRHAELR